ncbi:MAG: undecaprenyl-diphosphate phosphatase [Pseudomonadales bacterium]|nr:undecaprenyl-diphosphate phosphatase [Pseudomonadales bacterium]
MEWLQVIVLALVQGITEFLPVSSSAHLVLPAQLTSWPDQGLAFDVAVHFGTLIAVLAYFRKDLLSMLWAIGQAPAVYAARSSEVPSNAETEQAAQGIVQLLKLGLATIPVVIIGFLGKDFIQDNLRTVPVIATTTMLFGAALWYADRRPTTNTTITWQAAAIIGLAQSIALIPGTSRSGITITAALLLGLSRVEAAKFSFLLAIPTIAGAQLLLSLDLAAGNLDTDLAKVAAGAALAGVSAYLGIHYFMQLVERTGMLPYVLYRLVLGLVLFGLVYSGI